MGFYPAPGHGGFLAPSFRRFSLLKPSAHLRRSGLSQKNFAASCGIPIWKLSHILAGTCKSAIAGVILAKITALPIRKIPVRRTSAQILESLGFASPEEVRALIPKIKSWNFQNYSKPALTLYAKNLADCESDCRAIGAELLGEFTERDRRAAIPNRRFES